MGLASTQTLALANGSQTVMVLSASAEVASFAIAGAAAGFVASGITSGSFKGALKGAFSGAASSLLSSFVSGVLTSAGVKGGLNRVFTAGTVSQATGGKFVNGAISSAFESAVECYQASQSCSSGPLNADSELEKVNELLGLKTKIVDGVHVIYGEVTIAGDGLANAEKDIETFWNMKDSIKYKGKKYRAEIMVKPTVAGAKVNIHTLSSLEVYGAQLDYLKKVLACDPASEKIAGNFIIGGRATLGGRRIVIGKAVPGTYAHEFGHIMSLDHVPNRGGFFSGSIMSYRQRRAVKGLDLFNLYEGYK